MNTLTKQTRINIKNASKVLGVEEADILERASVFYLDAIEKDIELKREFDFWDYLSDEALAKSRL
jgi:hypothetical protein